MFSLSPRLARNLVQACCLGIVAISISIGIHVTTLEKRPRGAAPLVPWDQVTKIFDMGGTWRDLVDLGYAEATAKLKETDWKKQIGHPDIDHPHDKCVQIVRTFSWLLENVVDPSQTVTYESHAGLNGGCTAQYRTLGGTIYNFTYDKDDHEHTDCIARYHAWAKANPKTLIDILDIDPYTSAAYMFETGVLDRLKPHSLLFYTFAPYTYQNVHLEEENFSVFGAARLNPEIVETGINKMLAKRGMKATVVGCLKLGKPRGGVYRMAFQCEAIPAKRRRDHNQENLHTLAKATKQTPVAEMSRVEKAAIVAKVAKTVDMTAAEQEAWKKIDLGIQMLANATTDHAALLADILAETKLDRANKHLDKPR
jgi:hypothetical protein